MGAIGGAPRNSRARSWPSRIAANVARSTASSSEVPVPVLRDYFDIPGFCCSVTKEKIAEHGSVLTPGRYVGAEEVEDDDEPFEDKMQRLTHQLHEQFAESSRLEAAIRSNLEGLGYGG